MRELSGPPDDEAHLTDPRPQHEGCVSPADEEPTASRPALHLVPAGDKPVLDAEIPTKSKPLSSTERSRRHRARQRNKSREASVAAPLPPPGLATGTLPATATPAATPPATLGAEVATTCMGTDVVAYAERVAVSERPSRTDRAIIMPAILVVTSIALGATGLVLNARFAASFGATRDAAVLLAAIGVALDVLAMTLPAAAAQLFEPAAPGLRAGRLGVVAGGADHDTARRHRLRGRQPWRRHRGAGPCG